MRRTRVSMEYSHRGSESAQRVAEIMGAELGWSQEKIDAEAQLYRERVVAELMSQSSADDNEADAKSKRPIWLTVGVGGILAVGGGVLLIIFGPKTEVDSTTAKTSPSSPPPA